MSSKLKIQKGKNYSYSNTGALSELDQHTFHITPGDEGIPGKLFLHDPLELSAMEVSLNKLPAGAGMPFYHTHTEQEELYVFVGGKGQFQIDGDTFDITEGSVVCVRPEGVRTWRNNSTEDLYYVVVQAKSGSLSGRTIKDAAVLDQAVVWSE